MRRKRDGHPVRESFPGEEAPNSHVKRRRRSVRVRKHCKDVRAERLISIRINENKSLG